MFWNKVLYIIMNIVSHTEKEQLIRCFESDYLTECYYSYTSCLRVYKGQYYFH